MRWTNAKKKAAIDRWKYGKMGAASGVRMIGLDGLGL